MDLIIKTLLNSVYLKLMHTWFLLGRTALNPVAYNQENKSGLNTMFFFWNCFKLVFTTFWKSQNDWFAFVSAFQMHFSSQKKQITHNLNLKQQ